MQPGFRVNMKNASVVAFLSRDEFSRRIAKLKMDHGGREGGAKKLAPLFGVHWTTINRWANGEVDPAKISGPQLDKIRLVLGMSVPATDRAHDLQSLSVTGPKSPIGEEADKTRMLFAAAVAKLAKLASSEDPSQYFLVRTALEQMASLSDAELQELAESGTTDLVRRLLGLRSR